MDKLEAAYRAWRAAPIPSGCRGDESEDLHGDLLVADTWVAEDLVPYIESGATFNSAFDVLPRLLALHARATELIEDPQNADPACAILCADYAKLLIDVYVLFLDRISQPK